MSNPTTPTPDPVKLLEAIAAARAEVTHAQAARTRGEAGYADTCRAEYRLQLRLQEAQDAGVLVRDDTATAGLQL